MLGDRAKFGGEQIPTLTAKGRERAKVRSLKMGRRPKPTAHQEREVIKRRDKGEPVREIARTFGVLHSTISRLTRCRHNFTQRNTITENFNNT